MFRDIQLRNIFEYMCIQICTQFLFILSATSIPHKLEIMSKSKSDFLAMNVSWYSDELELYTNQASITSSTILTIISITIFLMSVAVQKAIFKMLKRLPQRAINHIIYPYMVKKIDITQYPSGNQPKTKNQSILNILRWDDWTTIWSSRRLMVPCLFW